MDTKPSIPPDTSDTSAPDDNPQLSSFDQVITNTLCIGVFIIIAIVMFILVITNSIQAARYYGPTLLPTSATIQNVSKTNISMCCPGSYSYACSDVTKCDFLVSYTVGTLNYQNKLCAYDSNGASIYSDQSYPTCRLDENGWIESTCSGFYLHPSETSCKYSHNQDYKFYYEEDNPDMIWDNDLFTPAMTTSLVCAFFLSLSLFIISRGYRLHPKKQIFNEKIYKFFLPCFMCCRAALPRSFPKDTASSEPNPQPPHSTTQPPVIVEPSVQRVSPTVPDRESVVEEPTESRELQSPVLVEPSGQRVSPAVAAVPSEVPDSDSEPLPSYEELINM